MEPSYLLKTYWVGDTVEIEKTISWRYGRSILRGEKKAPTPEDMAAYNLKSSWRELTRRINANFTPRDLYLTLTYKRGCRPDPREGKKNMAAFLRKLRSHFKKRGETLKYIWRTAYGERGAIHHHIVFSGMDIRDIRDMWPHGSYEVKPLYKDKQYSALAHYMVYQERQGETPEDRVDGRNWNSSRNLTVPQPKVEKVAAQKWREPPIAPRGYLIEIDSIDAGVNPKTGAPYLFYRLLKIPPKSKVMTPDGVLLREDAAAKWLREQNKQDVKQKWKTDKIQPLRSTEVKKHAAKKRVPHLRP